MLLVVLFSFVFRLPFLLFSNSIFVVHQPSFAQIRSSNVPFLFFLLLLLVFIVIVNQMGAVTVPQNQNIYKSISYILVAVNALELHCNAVTIQREKVGR